MGSSILAPDTLLELREVQVTFPGARGTAVQAVAGVSLTIKRGETLGLVGESGCGKSSLARAILQLPPPGSGRVFFDGVDLTTLEVHELRQMRPRMQMVFQDPQSSLNPGRRIDRSVAAPLRVLGNGSKSQIEERTHAMLERVGLHPERFAHRYPRQLSGGQCQRVSIARALMCQPELLICDEPVSALDVSVQAQILNLLDEMKAAFGLTMLFISHDLAVVKKISDRVAVMYLGKICELADSEALYSRPAHPYTAALLNAIPEPDPSKKPMEGLLLTGELPSPSAPPSGCRFRTRCPKAQDDCATTEPALREHATGHFVACHHPLKIQQVLT
jgi:peptide/nickel transport system ATP-binding protein